MKKIFTILLIAILVILPITTAFAADDIITLDAFGDNITAELNKTTKTLTLSGTGQMYDFTAYQSPATIQESNINTLIIEDGITSIGNNAFFNLTAVTSITIPSTVTSIGIKAFRECIILPSIIIPKNVGTIGDNAFAYCVKLATITNKYNGVQTIGSNSFEGMGIEAATEKITFLDPANTSFSGIMTTAGYTIKNLPTEVTGSGSVESIVPINGTINSTIISVSHPASVEFAINPNLENPFVAPEIIITNNSRVPVNVTVKSLDSATGGTLQFTDVAPNDKDWDNLEADDTKKYIALGVCITNEEGWNTGYDTNTCYAIDSGNVHFGSLNSGITGCMAMTANHGLAFDQNYTAVYNLVFEFDLT